MSIIAEDNNTQDILKEYILTERDHSDVMEDIGEIAADYKKLASAFKLPIATQRNIECHRQNSPPWDALSDVVTEWLRWNYDYEEKANRRWLINAVKSIHRELSERLMNKYT